MNRRVGRFWCLRTFRPIEFFCESSIFLSLLRSVAFVMRPLRPSPPLSLSFFFLSFFSSSSLRRLVVGLGSLFFFASLMCSLRPHIGEAGAPMASPAVLSLFFFLSLPRLATALLVCLLLSLVLSLSLSLSFSLASDPR